MLYLANQLIKICWSCFVFINNISIVFQNILKLYINGPYANYFTNLNSRIFTINVFQNAIHFHCHFSFECLFLKVTKTFAFAVSIIFQVYVLLSIVFCAEPTLSPKVSVDAKINHIYSSRTPISVMMNNHENRLIFNAMYDHWWLFNVNTAGTKLETF